MSGRLVLVGNVIADLALEVPALPERGGDVLSDRTRLTAGGGFNVLAAAGRLGAGTVFAGPHGTGPYGDLVREALDAEGVRTLLPPRTDGDTSFSVALVEPDGERTFVTSFGVDARMTPSEAEKCAAEVRPGDLVQLSGYGLVMPVNGPLLAALTARLPEDAVLCLDPAPLVADIPHDVLEPVLARTDWLSANVREAALMCGEDEPERAAAVLRGRLPRAGAGVLVRTGRDGCVLAPPDGSGPVRVPGLPVTAVDSTGAGDAHVGAFLGLSGEGAPPFAAARAANAAAAYAVTRRGPATAPTRDRLRAFARERGAGDVVALLGDEDGRGTP